MTTKTCTKCRKTFPLNAFTKNRAKPSGHGARCKPCHRIAVNARAARAREAKTAAADEAVRKARAEAEAAPPPPVETETRGDWRHRAACRNESPELFFPIGSTGDALVQIEEAKTVCRRCPSEGACLAWAIRTGQSQGVWGGLSEQERATLKRRSHPSRKASGVTA